MTGFLTLFVGLLASGMPVFLVLGLCAGAMFVASGQPLVGAAQLVINELNSPSLMALPLFVMAAAFMRRTTPTMLWFTAIWRLMA